MCCVCEFDSSHFRRSCLAVEINEIFFDLVEVLHHHHHALFFLDYLQHSHPMLYHIKLCNLHLMFASPLECKKMSHPHTIHFDESEVLGKMRFPYAHFLYSRGVEKKSKKAA